MSVSKNIEYNQNSWPASADLSSYQYHAVTLNSSGKLALAGATDAIVGILQDKPDAADKMGLVAMGGISKAVLDGSGTAIAIGDKLAADASGHLVKTTTSGDDYGAIALEACTASGDIKQVLVVPFGTVV